MLSNVIKNTPCLLLLETQENVKLKNCKQDLLKHLITFLNEKIRKLNHMHIRSCNLSNYANWLQHDPGNLLFT